MRLIYFMLSLHIPIHLFITSVLHVHDPHDQLLYETKPLYPHNYWCCNPYLLVIKPLREIDDQAEE